MMGRVGCGVSGSSELGRGSGRRSAGSGVGRGRGRGMKEGNSFEVLGQGSSGLARVETERSQPETERRDFEEVIEGEEEVGGGEAVVDEVEELAEGLDVPVGGGGNERRSWGERMEADEGFLQSRDPGVQF